MLTTRADEPIINCAITQQPEHKVRAAKTKIHEQIPAQILESQNPVHHHVTVIFVSFVKRQENEQRAQPKNRGVRATNNAHTASLATRSESPQTQAGQQRE